MSLKRPTLSDRVKFSERKQQDRRMQRAFLAGHRHGQRVARKQERRNAEDLIEEAHDDANAFHARWQDADDDADH